jgi:pimeloyl-ACP methyl ester carboxylesterase
MVDDGPGQPLGERLGALKTPVWLFTGRRDATVPPECGARFFRAVSAPAKRWVWFEHSAHHPFLEEPDRFHAELLRVARATAPGPTGAPSADHS